MEDLLEQPFGHYHLSKLLGEGGFGKVHLARHLDSNTDVAIKILDTRLLSREQENFLKEARVIASLDHPAIVRLLDCGIEGNQPFLAMNYAPNGTLRQRYPKGSKVPVEQVVQYVKPLASALAYAHERKLIHRDVKPENMLLGSDDTVLLGDFGIALLTSSSTSRSTTTAAGTVSYMAPEQILGKPCVASDQYALGVVVYEWLCGALPFTGSFAEVGQQHLYASPPSFAEQGVEIVPAVEEVVRKALAKKPEERFADVQEFATALEESYLHPESLPTTVSDMMIFIPDAPERQDELIPLKKMTELLVPPPPELLAAPQQQRSRSHIWRALIIVLCLLLLIALAPDIRSWIAARPVPLPTAVVSANPTGAPTARPTSAPTTVPVKPTLPPTTAPTANATVTPTLVPAGPTIVPTSPPILSNANSNGSMFGYDLTHSHVDPDGAGVSRAVISQLTVAWTAPVQAYASPIYANGLVYVPGLDGKIHAFDATTGTTLWVTPVSSNQVESSVAVAGGIVYVGDGDGKVDALNASTGTILWTVQAHGRFSSRNCSPAVANGIVYIGADSGIFYALNASTGALLWSYSTADTNGPDDISSPAVVNGVVYFTTEKSVYALDARAGTLKWSIALPHLFESSPAIANGILYVGADRLYALNASTGATVWASAANGGFGSPGVDSGFVYAGSSDQNVYQFYRDLGAIRWMALTGGAMIYSSPMIAGGVVFMGSSDGTFYALHPFTGAVVWSFHLGSAVEGEPAIANGFVYLVGTQNGTLYAFHLPS